MDMFVVLKIWNYASPDVVGSFAEESEALQFASLSKRSDSEHKYAVARLIAVTK